MKVEVKMHGLEGVLATLQSLPAEIVSKRGGPVKSSLRKAAKVIEAQARINLQQVVANTDDEGKKYSTGLLLQNLIVTRGKKPKHTMGEKYLVRVRAKSYQRKGKPMTTRLTASALEYGTSKQPAEPWLRPAASAKASEAMATFETELLKSVDRVVKKLARQNRAKK
jgi:HK97 gp10 family phage protein